MRQPRLAYIAAALFFLIVGAVLYAPYLAELPRGLHAWAQSDRLALALGYYDYGFQLFTPRTYNLSSIGGITGVEFPFQAYLAALGGVVFGRSSIVLLFRLLDVAMVLLGFYYLFRLVYEQTGHFVAGLVPGAFLLSSPVFVFYAGSTLPDPFSVSLSFIGYYYWLRFFTRRAFSDLPLAVLLLGLAALIKTTTLLHLGAVLGITFLWAFFQPELLTRRQRLVFTGLVLLVLGATAAYFLRIQYLNATYQSGLFLAGTRPITDPETLHQVRLHVRGFWLGQYASTLQYYLLAVCGLLFVGYARRNLRQHLLLSLLLLATLVLGYVFVQLMGAQFRDHDYYIIAPVVPPVLLLLLLALLNVARHQGKIRHAITGILAVMVVVLLVQGYKRLHRRMSDEGLVAESGNYLWMRGGAAELARLKVPAAASILVFNEPAPNLGLAYFDRRGQVWQPQDLATVTATEILDRMAADNLDYLLMAPSAYAGLAPQHPALAAELSLLSQSPAVILQRRNRQRPW
ncbi:hypothetical protein GCM10023185_26090 [Hymenobacter saemangeumensis]|uniref:Glycosyltransferase RgtA/B/C/D-like domain-containing protein n=1 Tax=Hymenobacter saemangeumensis TaxID=1084522 RepID=A0ABP8IIA2_9BACT